MFDLEFANVKRTLLYPEGVGFHSPGSRSAPWESVRSAPWEGDIAQRTLEGEPVPRTSEIGAIVRFCTPEGLHWCYEHVLYNPFGVENIGTIRIPRVRCATLGCGI